MIVLVVVPIALSAITAVLIWGGLREPQRITWEPLLLALIAWAIAGGLLYFMASVGGLGEGLAFVIGLSASAIMLLAIPLLLIFVHGKRKILAGLLALVFPIFLFLSIQGGNANSPESTIEANGIVVAQALNQYRIDHGKYPLTLNELMPKYLADLKSPDIISVWGWLYISTGDEFTLGFVENVEWAGYDIYVYSSNVPDWKYLPNSTGPFTLGPTPAR